MAQHLSLIDTDLKHMTVFESGDKDMTDDFLFLAAAYTEPNVIVRHDTTDEALFIAIDQAEQKGFTIFGDPRKESVHAQ